MRSGGAVAEVGAVADGRELTLFCPGDFCEELLREAGEGGRSGARNAERPSALEEGFQDVAPDELGMQFGVSGC